MGSFALDRNGPSPDAFARAEERYFRGTPTSRALYEQAKKALPEGVGRAGLQYLHYPVFVDRAEGRFLYDVDGRAILDMWNAASALPLGHNHPTVMAAVEEQLARGLGFVAPNRLEVELAELLCGWIPSMERIRFTASGTEATMFAVRLARAFTGRRLLARMAGSYHGLHDMMSTGEGASIGGTWLDLNDHPVAAGVLPEVREGVVFLPYNDLDGCARVLEANAGELAAVIVEPFMGTAGGIPGAPEFLSGLRRLCDRHGALLIFDEMISITLGMGGAQALFGVMPDLTATGKLIGGGMPVGAFGGRADIMELLASKDGVPPVLHTGTWNGHPVVMAAGLAQMKLLDAEVFRYLSHIGDYMRKQVRALAKEMRVALQVTGIQHLSAFHYTPEPVRSPAEARRGDVALARRVSFSLLSQGFWMTGGRSNLSTEIKESDVDRFIEALAVAFEEAGASATA